MKLSPLGGIKFFPPDNLLSIPLTISFPRSVSIGPIALLRNGQTLQLYLTPAVGFMLSPAKVSLSADLIYSQRLAFSLSSAQRLS